ncbi:hypothetical protein SALBM311S_00498 [Streptomyces alboniger]
MGTARVLSEQYIQVAVFDLDHSRLPVRLFGDATLTYLSIDTQVCC